MNLQLPTGKTVYISTYEFLFKVKDEEVDMFFQACIADDLGSHIENPFSDSAMVQGTIEYEDTISLKAIPDVSEDVPELD